MQILIDLKFVFYSVFLKLCYRQLQVIANWGLVKDSWRPLYTLIGSIMLNLIKWYLFAQKYFKIATKNILTKMRFFGKIWYKYKYSGYCVFRFWKLFCFLIENNAYLYLFSLFLEDERGKCKGFCVKVAFLDV